MNCSNALSNYVLGTRLIVLVQFYQKIIKKVAYAKDNALCNVIPLMLPACGYMVFSRLLKTHFFRCLMAKC